MTKYTDLEIGDVLPIEGSRFVLAEWLDEPEWYIFTTAPQSELPAIAWLTRNGVDESDAWCPTETRWRIVPRGKRGKVPYETPIAPGYIFVRFDRRPVWHRVFERSKGKLTGVVSYLGSPLIVPEEDISRMKYLPKRIEIERDRQARRREIRAGDKVDVVSGPLAGWAVDISRIHAGIAYFIAPLLGEREISVPVSRLRKVQG